MDESLIGALAARDGLIQREFVLGSENTDNNDEIIPFEVYKNLRSNVQEIVREQFKETTLVQARNPVTKSKFSNIAVNAIRDKEIAVKEPDIPTVVKRLFSDILGYGPLEEYFNDPEVTEIKVNGTRIRVEKRGKEIKVNKSFESVEQAVDLVRRMISPTGRRIDNSVPEVKARLHDGSRLIAQIAPIAVDGCLITIRRFRQDINAAALINRKSVSREVMDFFKAAIAARCNIIISGGTSSGKTTWLNVLASFIREDLSLVTIEDPAELQLQHPDVRRLEARPANMEGKGEYTMSDGVKAALRMAPDIIILGEALGKEAFDILQAMNSGQQGSLATIHADSAKLSIARLANMVPQAGMGLPHDAILDQIKDAVDIIIFVTQDRTGRRRLDHVAEVGNAIKAADGRTIDVEVNILWQYDENTATWDWVADKFKREEEFRIKGGWQCPR